MRERLSNLWAMDSIQNLTFVGVLPTRPMTGRPTKVPVLIAQDRGVPGLFQFHRWVLVVLMYMCGKIHVFTIISLWENPHGGGSTSLNLLTNQNLPLVVYPSFLNSIKFTE